jgi:transposase
MARRLFSTEQKAVIVRRHLVDKIAVSDVCDENKLQPSVLYGWLTQVFKNLPAALEPQASSKASSREKQLAARVEYLEAKLSKKDEVIAEISAEYVQLKKDVGEP